MNIYEIIAGELGVGVRQVEAAVSLLDEGSTVPFIARYRKEATGALDDTQLRKLSERLLSLRNLEERREQILGLIDKQGKLTDELKKKIDEAQTMVALEDLYLPYRPKRKTRAQIAIAKGLEPLALQIMLQGKESPETLAAKALKDLPEISDLQEALKGASDIIAEHLSEDAGCRERIRSLGRREGIVAVKQKEDDETSVYRMYQDYSEPVSKMPGHRILAVNRGEKEGALTVKVQMDEEKAVRVLCSSMHVREGGACSEFLHAAAEDAYERLIEPSVVRELRNELTQKAAEGAMVIFADNLSQLLMQPPVAGKRVLGWDPGFRTGCKLAVVDETGKVLRTGVAYATAAGEDKIEKAKQMVTEWIIRDKVTLIALGNGTASRESEKVISDIIKRVPFPVSYVIVNEAGASVYSASETAAKEFPDLDVGGRSAASMARRLQDPLSELVKIDPCALGVGQYQHDMDQKQLERTLMGVVEDCVNRVGADLNTASAALLGQISGLNAASAKNIVAYREENGAFTNRKQLLKVPRLGGKTFEQCAGFLRIRGGEEPLDATAVHPESYKAAKALMKELGIKEEDLGTDRLKGLSAKAPALAKRAGEFSVGEETLEDILKELEKPGLDPRETVHGPMLRSDVTELSDLKEGMELEGTVRNITDFGAFVDIGVHQDGLVHISQMSSKSFVKHPLDVVKLGQIVKVKVLSVDEKRKRISLTMKL